MVNLKLLQQMILTALFLVLTSSCATPPPTLDRVATSVAETKAIAVTLTAEVPTAVATAKPLPTDTIETVMPTPIATATLTVSLTPTYIPTSTPFKPQSGSWIGRGVFLNDAGEGGNLLCLFTVSEDRNQFESKFCAYSLRPFEEGKKYGGFASAAIAIIDNNFSMRLVYGNLPSIWFVDVEGVFVSQVLLEGTFVSPEGKGEWSARPKP